MIRRALDLLTELWLLAALLTFWWFASANDTSPFWPPLEKILIAFKENWLFAKVGSELVPSLIRIGEGFGYAAVIGIGLGLVLGSSPTARRALEPTLTFVRALPIAAVLPVALLVFGIGDSEKVFVITFAAVWPILMNTTDGIAEIDPLVHEVARVYRFRRRDAIFNVILPAAAPRIFAGLRLAISYALLAIVLAELFASTNGLGYFILNAQNTFRIDAMWSGIFLLSLLSYAVSALLALFEKRILYWHRGWRASALGDSVAGADAGAGWPQRRSIRTKEVANVVR